MVNWEAIPSRHLPYHFFIKISTFFVFRTTRVPWPLGEDTWLGFSNGLEWDANLMDGPRPVAAPTFWTFDPGGLGTFIVAEFWCNFVGIELCTLDRVGLCAFEPGTKNVFELWPLIIDGVRPFASLGLSFACIGLWTFAVVGLGTSVVCMFIGDVLLYVADGNGWLLSGTMLGPLICSFELLPTLIGGGVSFGGGEFTILAEVLFDITDLWLVRLVSSGSFLVDL